MAAEEQGAAMAARAPAPAAGRKKSSFAATCGLLSRYLKEKKGGLHGVTGLSMAPPATAGALRPTTTMNLLSALGAPAEEPSDVAKAATELRASESLEKKATTEPPPVLVAATGLQNGNNLREAAAEELQQLTIFYGGKVVVFDNFPSTKVKDLLQIVKPGDGAVKASGSAAHPDLPRPSHNSLSDVPIARRNSLHRFLEKRRDRIIAKAPYQSNSSVEATTGEKSWLGLGQEVAVKQEI